MERLAVDMDGVLADVYEQFFRYDEKDFGKRKPIEDVIGVEERKAFPYINEYVHAKGFFRTAPLVKDSVEVLTELNKNYELFIVSAAMEFPQSLPEKLEWLNEHFSFLRSLPGPRARQRESVSVSCSTDSRCGMKRGRFSRSRQNA